MVCVDINDQQNISKSKSKTCPTWGEQVEKAKGGLEADVKLVPGGNPVSVTGQ